MREQLLVDYARRSQGRYEEVERRIRVRGQKYNGASKIRVVVSSASAQAREGLYAHAMLRNERNSRCMWIYLVLLHKHVRDEMQAWGCEAERSKRLVVDKITDHSQKLSIRLLCYTTICPGEETRLREYSRPRRRTRSNARQTDGEHVFHTETLLVSKSCLRRNFKWESII